ncbi:FecCD family ABC transporter permease [Paenarthrobacter sp. NPDC089714]|uniref:FecCD family ABC transporter permease n=1 Tax=Paenarthrobacter sp. NPDC089714 TaxID=3364377 RepID=UPI0037F847D4
MNPVQNTSNPLPAQASRSRVPVGRLTTVGSYSFLWHPRTVVVVIALVLLVLLLGIVSMGTGTIRLSFGDVVGTLLGQNQNAGITKVVTGIRLPRLVTAVFVGASLGMAGAVFQSISRNALGSPDIIGFTTGSATGAVLQIIVFNAGAAATAAAAVVGGLLTAGIVYLLSIKGGVTGGYRLVLIGIGVGSILGALNTLLLAKGSLELAQSAYLWLNGSLNARTWEQAAPVAVGFLVLLPLIGWYGRNLNLMELGDDSARQLGVSVERTRLVMMGAAVALTALATAAAGPIAFIALAAPQLVLRLTRGTRVPLLSSAVMGAALLVGSDLLSLYLPVKAAIPIGLMTGLVGGVYLLWLLTRSRQL